MVWLLVPGRRALAQHATAVPRQDFAHLAAEADAARTSDRLAEAARLYQQALAMRPTWQKGWWSLGTVEYDRSQYAKSARAFQKLISLQPKISDGTPYVMLGLCEFELGEDGLALENLEKGKSLGMAVDTQLRDVMRFHEGVLLQRMGKFESAREVLSGLCADGVETKELVDELGLVALQRRDKSPPAEGSAAAYVVTHVGEATCMAAQNKFDLARQAYASVVQQYPDFANIHYAYGRLLLDAHDPAAAKQQFQLEIQNQPADVIARLQIAAASYRIDSASGLPYAEQAVKLDPHYPFGHYMLGLLLLDTGNYSAAIPQLEIARRDFPNEAQVYFALGSAYAHVGRKSDAARARAVFTQLQQHPVSAPAGSPGELDARPQQ